MGAKLEDATSRGDAPGPIAGDAAGSGASGTGSSLSVSVVPVEADPAANGGGPDAQAASLILGSLAAGPGTDAPIPPPLDRPTVPQGEAALAAASAAAEPAAAVDDEDGTEQDETEAPEASAAASEPVAPPPQVPSPPPTPTTAGATPPSNGGPTDAVGAPGARTGGRAAAFVASGVALPTAPVPASFAALTAGAPTGAAMLAAGDAVGSAAVDPGAASGPRPSASMPFQVLHRAMGAGSPLAGTPQPPGDGEPVAGDAVEHPGSAKTAVEAFAVAVDATESAVPVDRTVAAGHADVPVAPVPVDVPPAEAGLLGAQAPGQVGATTAAHGAGAVAHAAREAQAPAVPLGQVPMTIGLRSLAGSSRFEIRLDPEGLGRIEVKLDIDRERGTVMTHLVVDRVETLAMLQRDAGNLQQALAQTGLDAGGGGINLSLRGEGGAGGQGGGENARPGAPGAARTPEKTAALEAAPLRTLPGLRALDIRI